MGTSPAAVKGMYKELLRQVVKFPSVKRAAIREDIRLEFRDHVRETDGKKIAAYVDIGLRGLDTMRKYTNLDKRSSNWKVQLEEDPLGQHAAEQRRAERLYAERLEAQAKKQPAHSEMP